MKFNVVYTLIQQRLNWNCIKKLQSIQVFFPRACLRFFDCNFFKAVLLWRAAFPDLIYFVIIPYLVLFAQRRRRF